MNCRSCGKSYEPGPKHPGYIYFCIGCNEREGKEVKRNRSIGSGVVTDIADHDTAKRANRKMKRPGAGVMKAMNKPKGNKS